MSATIRFYRGLEIHPLVFPHQPTLPGLGRNYEEGFDAAVRIREPEGLALIPRTRVFGLLVKRPFLNAGDARRASIAYAEHLIDTCPADETVLDLKESNSRESDAGKQFAW
ncbi:hypothetical protein F4827_003354 [Paraburkholderia bannensis]|uniref:Uncharacterized protein n=1 Tax=Paraburkholderia bannensis TaxID=765414 RepID=A0A7W9WTE1_9BURK|nr:MULTISPECIES: hypothetical protein [Paraburkholderia]MBB3258486.1 hypothetical protein [Paraburkholderia sp. WP4_3_2]MBB6103499.1 hypothetical protein [Paraburkholderia bannensis]